MLFESSVEMFFILAIGIPLVFASMTLMTIGFTLLQHVAGALGEIACSRS